MTARQRVFGHLALHYMPGDEQPARRLLELLGCTLVDNGPVPGNDGFATVHINSADTNHAETIFFLSAVTPEQLDIEHAITTAMQLDANAGILDAYRAKTTKAPESISHIGIRYADFGDLESVPASVEHAASPGVQLAGRAKLVKYAARPGLDTAVAARLSAYVLATRMQTSIPPALSFADESAETRRLYGIDDPIVGPSARNFLLARRLIERGVRFVQIYNGGALGSPRINWDAHENVKENHDRQGLLLDQPCAALLADLKRRGMLDDTLVVWSSEFGRTPFTQGLQGLGRDHHQLPTIRLEAFATLGAIGEPFSVGGILRLPVRGVVA